MKFSFTFFKYKWDVTQAKISIDYIIYAFLVVGLYGSVSNLVYISPIPSLICIVLFPFFLYQNANRSIKTITLTRRFYLYYFASLLSAFIYYPKSYMNFGFYRYDGAFIISYAPLLLSPFLVKKFNLDYLIKKFLIFATVVCGVSFLFNIISTKFASILDWSNPETYYHGLFRSTNAAGGFLSILLSLNILLIFNERRKVWYICFILNIIFLFATTSRGSLLGLLLGFIFYYLYLNGKEKWVYLVIFFVTLTQIVILYFSFSIFDEYIRDADLSEVGVGEYIVPLFGQVQTKSANLLIRAVDTWPRGIDCFVHSPLFGTGVGSINDIPLKYSNNFLINSNVQVVKKFDDSHAHHSYFHILGEQGLVGLLVFLSFWKSILNYLIVQKKSIVRDFLIMSFFNLTIMSFTEHRIVSPSNALPFIILLSLFIMGRNSEKKCLNLN